MANLKVCDFCGRVLHNEHAERFRVIIKHSVFNAFGDSANERLDICSDCMRKIRNYIKRERKEGGE